MWWPLCSKVTPRMFPSLPQMWCTTLPFSTFLGSIHLYSFLAWFLQCLVLGWSSCWLDGFPTSCMYLYFPHNYAVWLPLVAGAALFALSPSSSISSTCVCSVPTSTHLVSSLIPLSQHFWGMSRGSHSFSSFCRLSPVRGLELFCLVTCRVLSYVFYDLLVQTAPPCKSGRVELISDIFFSKVILSEWIWSSHFSTAWAAARKAWTGIWALTSVMPVQCSPRWAIWWAIWPTGSRSLSGLIVSP